jgi:type II secretory pathway predicted ATPase ExeA
MIGTTTADVGLERDAAATNDTPPERFHSRIHLPHYDEALARLEYVASRQRSFALLAGPAGSGKTHLLRKFADELRLAAVATVSVDACGCSEAELLRECCDELGLGCPRDWSADALRSALLEAVRGRCTVGTPVVVIIDHADRLDHGGIRLIERLLHGTSDLAGPTVVAACREPAPSALAHIARHHADVRIQLTPLTAEETGSIIQSQCGASHGAEFTADAVQDVHSLTQGDLRQLERIWRLLQNAAEVEETDSIDTQMVEWAACELPE